MRKVTLIFGLVYLFWSLWEFTFINKLLILYEKANVHISNPYLQPSIILITGLILVFGYIANFKKNNLYKSFIIIGVLGFIFYFLSLFYYDFKASMEISKIIKGY